MSSKESGSGFIAGTLVLTNATENHGFKPIEQVKVGDQVLCKPEQDGAEATFKTVLKTFVYTDQDLCFLETEPLVDWVEGVGGSKIKGSGSLHRFGVTANQRFWYIGRCSIYRSIQEFAELGNPEGKSFWGRVYQLEQYDMLLGKNDRPFAATTIKPLSQMKDSKLAWLENGHGTPGDNDSDWSHGYVYDLEKREDMFSDFPLLQQDARNLGMMDEEDETYPQYRATVYNLTVEGDNNYFVALSGLWAHGQS